MLRPSRLATWGSLTIWPTLVPSPLLPSRALPPTAGFKVDSLTTKLKEIQIFICGPREILREILWGMFGRSSGQPRTAFQPRRCWWPREPKQRKRADIDNRFTCKVAPALCSMPPQALKMICNSSSSPNHSASFLEQIQTCIVIYARCRILFFLWPTLARTGRRRLSNPETYGCYPWLAPLLLS